ncbi:F-box domain containing protein [Tanacetum coccineum]
MPSSLQAASMDRLPPDVLSNNIFIRLPAKLFAQMRCVSKHWNDLLSRPSIKSHLDYSKHNNEEIILVFYDLFRFNSSFKPFTEHPTRNPKQELRSLIKIPVMEPNSIFNHYIGQGCYIIGSVNGLVCFYKRSDPPHNVYIWNPSLSAVLTLPPFAMPSPDTNEHFDIFYRESENILAYDLGLETFSEISLPADYKNDYRSYVLGILGGKLCVMFDVINGDSEVWILAYNLLYFYDPIAEKVKLSNIPARILGSAKIVQYIDSLVWIVPSRSEINCCSISSLQI